MLEVSYWLDTNSFLWYAIGWFGLRALFPMKEDSGHWWTKLWYIATLIWIVFLIRG